MCHHASIKLPTRRTLLALPACFVAASLAHATTAVIREERSVANFNELKWDAAGELIIEQTGRERLVIEAEAQVLRRIVTRVQGQRLEIGFAPGHFETNLPIRFMLELRQLRRLELHGSGLARVAALRAEELTVALRGSNDLRIDTLHAGRFELNHTGAGDVHIGSGRVDAQRIVFEGSGTVDAEALNARSSDVLLSGSGEVRVAAERRLAASIDGSGDIVYRGQPQITQLVRGAGALRRSRP